MNDIKKMREIDEMLENDMLLNNYINKMDNKEFEVPLNLKEKIKFKINKKQKKYFIDICKIAACLIFSLAICRTDFIKNDDFKKKDLQEIKTTISIDEKVSDLCKWLTTPINLNKEEK